LRCSHDERIAVLVNDFGSIDIDGELVVSVEGETLALSGGCICCSIRADLEETVRDILAGDQPPERIVIEASGVSDPTAVAMTFFTGNLRGRCRVESIINMIDSEAFLQTDPSMKPLLGGQLMVADLVVLNKADVCPEGTMVRVESNIRSAYPRARVIRTSFARVPRELLFGVTDRSLRETGGVKPIQTHVHEVAAQEHHHHGHDDHTLIFDTWSFTEEAPMDRYRLMKELADLPTTVYRAKGFVHARDVPDHEVVVHVAGRRVHQQRGKPWGDRPRQTRLVIIAGHGQLPLESLRERLTACSRPANEERSNVPEGAETFMARFASRLRAHGIMD
ncbi:MAG: GTP-binding protein, partial [Acidobacteriota bacterium]|nr:GTP-binding protein [Acidobacteriota bacterium]